MAILIDFNQVAISAISAVCTGNQRVPLTVDVARHAILNSIRYSRVKYFAKHGEIIVCCDNFDYWRKQEFPYYKASRKKLREASELDWKLVSECMETVKGELVTKFPYKVVEARHAEGDDVIATLTKYFQTNELVDGPSGGLSAMFEEKSPQPIMIVSADHDFIQLQKYKSVSQYSMMLNKLVTDPSPRKKLHAKVLGGDAGDGIPNILSDDDTFVMPDKRQKPMRQDKLDKFLTMEYGAPFEDSTLERNFHRNRLLIDFDYIPQRIEDSILEAYHAAPKAPRYGLMMYFASHNLEQLSTKIKEF